MAKLSAAFFLLSAAMAVSGCQSAPKPTLRMRADSLLKQLPAAPGEEEFKNGVPPAEP